jgi:hypothetical protein
MLLTRDLLKENYSLENVANSPDILEHLTENSKDLKKNYMYMACRFEEKSSFQKRNKNDSL